MIRRRRKCQACGATWTTSEVVESAPVATVRDVMARLLIEVREVRTAVDALLRQARRLEAEVYEKLPEPTEKGIEHEYSRLES